MDPKKVKTSKIENCPLDSEDEFIESIIRGIDDYKAGRVTVCRNKDEALDHLDSL